jgi:hypothetical protein
MTPNIKFHNAEKIGFLKFHSTLLFSFFVCAFRSKINHNLKLLAYSYKYRISFFFLLFFFEKAKIRLTWSKCYFSSLFPENKTFSFFKSCLYSDRFMRMNLWRFKWVNENGGRSKKCQISHFQLRSHLLVFWDREGRRKETFCHCIGKSMKNENWEDLTH